MKSNGCLPPHWSIETGIMHREDGVTSFVIDSSGKIDREKVATILENYGYKDHAKRWYMSPIEAASEDLLKACKLLLMHIAINAPDRISTQDKEVIFAKWAISKAEGK
jgi:hypothetical protein